ncbi:MAG: quinone-dependent dihydroorotate dehydrogenase [Aliifodinibius sp.]|nr:quinone-dependent dihydroorotate dehydrogenase [candidate division KSB1 bacterium]NIV11093.1 quinone-dependent dihydroorotate dehydrogenase [Fodinibius sp.]NIS23541.1 quinone-dependent dihydroorotate dehydrogenase [candidate division KSB1 bacterium]NIU24168.1 quinone-dependent dihydroorotate dehydrogenase [candidate division KSB1 bacterium]NIW18022.1 quinone-dependent dihydroorotate dehydrogenase [candidate division KSB1 bacterium]
MYKAFIRKLLFLLPPESAHHLLIHLLHIPLFGKLLRQVYHFEHPSLQRTVFGLTFQNPVGLAAGFDKDGLAYSQLADLGFGFVEVGTVTPKAQPGNPRPRLFRLPAEESLINRMGFNNDGAEALAHRLKRRRGNLIIGGNIGKNKQTPLAEAWKDYLFCFQILYDLVDYFVINVSSPNTPNLRQLQAKKSLAELLSYLQSQNTSALKAKPVLLKIAPDLNERQLDDIIEIVSETELHGVIATNTTISRDNLQTPIQKLEKIGDGGVSGKPVRERSTEVIAYLHQQSKGAFPIVGVGGIHAPADALEKLDAGATLIQLYTGFVYKGPALIRSIKKALVTHG